MKKTSNNGKQKNQIRTEKENIEKYVWKEKKKIEVNADTLTTRTKQSQIRKNRREWKVSSLSSVAAGKKAPPKGPA